MNRTFLCVFVRSLAVCKQINEIVVVAFKGENQALKHTCPVCV